jgi:hypothetical protein
MASKKRFSYTFFSWNGLKILYHKKPSNLNSTVNKLPVKNFTTA